jgi:hypothetical protein
MAENHLLENGRLVNVKSHVIPGRTGVITGIAASGIIGAIRNVGPEELIVSAVDMSFMTEAASSAFGGVGFGVHKISGFSALAATGARAAAPLPLRKRTNDFTALLPAGTGVPLNDTLVFVEVSDTAVLSGLTVSPAAVLTDPFGVLIPRRSFISATVCAFDGQSRWTPGNKVPISLTSDEGLVFTSLNAFPTTLSGRFAFGVDVHFS